MFINFEDTNMIATNDIKIFDYHERTVLSMYIEEILEELTSKYENKDSFNYKELEDEISTKVQHILKTYFDQYSIKLVGVYAEQEITFANYSICISIKFYINDNISYCRPESFGYMKFLKFKKEGEKECY